MAYMLLVVEKVGDRAARSESEGRALYDRMLEFSAELKERGLLTLGQSLKTDAAGARVTRRGRKVDGPRWAVRGGEGDDRRFLSAHLRHP